MKGATEEDRTQGRRYLELFAQVALKRGLSLPNHIPEYREVAERLLASLQLDGYDFEDSFQLRWPVSICGEKTIFSSACCARYDRRISMRLSGTTTMPIRRMQTDFGERHRPRRGSSSLRSCAVSARLQLRPRSLQHSRLLPGTPISSTTLRKRDYFRLRKRMRCYDVGTARLIRIAPWHPRTGSR